MLFILLKILSILVTIVVPFYILAIHRNGYWRRRGIPGPKPAPFKGNMGSLFGQKPGVFQYWKWTKQFGRVYGIQYGWFNVLVTSDPRMAHELLVEKYEHFRGRLLLPEDGDFDDERNQKVNMFSAIGKRWKRLRTIANPAFSVMAFKRVMPIMDDAIQVTMDFLEKASQQVVIANGAQHTVDLFPFFNEMTLDVILRVAFGQKECQQFHNEELTKLTRNVFTRANNNLFHYYDWQFPWLAPHLIGPLQRIVGINPFETILKNLMKTVYERKKQKRENVGAGRDGEQKQQTRRADFVDMFLEYETEEEQIITRQGDGDDNRNKSVEKKITTNELLRTCMVFLLAGFDTTANSLSLVCHQLALHPDVQTKMFDEIESVCGNEESLTYEQMGKLKYVEATIKETLRLCPIASAVVSRVCEQTTTLGAYTVEKGTAVLLDIFSMHRDTNVWSEDAEEFRPERWLERDVPASAFYAFGGGSRICIGMRFALLEEKMALCHLLRKFRLQKSEQTEKDMDGLDLTGQVVLNPKSVTVQLVPRLHE